VHASDEVEERFGKVEFWVLVEHFQGGKNGLVLSGFKFPH
jgi:hypothetical protein